MIKSAFHVEESQFRDNEFVQVQLSVRPKNYEEFCNYQSVKIANLQAEISDLKHREEIKSYVSISDNEEEKGSYRPPSIWYHDLEQPMNNLHHEHVEDQVSIQI